MNESNDHTSTDKAPQKKLMFLRNAIIALSVSTTFGLLVWVLFDLLGWAELMTNAFLAAFPFAIGGITVYFSGWNNFFKWIGMPLLSVVLLFLAIFFLGVDGALCLVILAGPFLIASVVGGIFISLLRFALDIRRTSIAIIAAIPLVVGPIETQFNGIYEENEVITSVIVNGSREQVWRECLSVDSIQESELSWTFIHAIGVPKPVCAILDCEGVGGVRQITWRKGITFEERITAWREGKGFSYKFVIDTACLPLYALDKHVRVGGEYFDVLDGGYTLYDLPENRTLMQLHCRYRLKTRFNWYARLWGNFIVNDFQRVIATVIKGRVEKEFSPSLS